MVEASVWPYGLGIAVVIGLSILVQSLRKKRTIQIKRLNAKE